MKTWRLRQGADRRIRSGHPWIFSNELTESPKGHEPGAPVRLEDVKGQFLAIGYGNPHSLISFRALSYDSAVGDPSSRVFLVGKLTKAWQQRFGLGYTMSFRLCYGEGDFFPGLVVDRYLVQLESGKTAQVFAAQVLTAGAQYVLGDLVSFFQELALAAKQAGLSEASWEQTAVVLRNDVNIRKLEGLAYENSQVLKNVEGLSLDKCNIALHSPWAWSETLLMRVDLIEGQKTGFFLDQAYNIQVICELIKARTHFYKELKRPVKILDLCCYVGQWSTKMSEVFRKLGVPAEVTLVDVSDPALQMAKFNVERAGAAKIECLKMDVLEDLPRLQDRAYDIVIADPPAFIKAKKDLPTGSHAYLKMNTQAVRLARSGGLVASCSCSGLFKEEDMIPVLQKAVRRDGREARCIAHGGHAPDHPVLVSFPEGFYLKMFVHSVAED
jgi:23S rRNA (cytosine1962-C5)-methyltransferase